MNKWIRPCVALVYRHTLAMMRPAWFAEMVYWAALDIIAVGLLVRGMLGATQADQILSYLLVGMSLWLVIAKSALTIPFMLLDELFEANFIATFTTPIKLGQWVCAGMFMGVLAGALNMLIAWPIVWMAFGYNVWVLGPQLLLVILVLAICGWSLGFAVSAFMLFVGKKGTILTFQLVWSVLPFACVYYPIDVLPLVMQKIAWCVPMSHVFLGMRAHMMHDASLVEPLTYALLLAFVWLMVALCVFWWAFVLSKRRGLVRLELE